MGVLRKGGKRRAAFVAALSLGAFQALAIVGAIPAQAETCTFALATGTVTIESVGADTVTIDLSSATPAQIRSNGTPCSGGSANVNNTTTVSYIGDAANQDVIIDNDGPGGAFPATISWAVDGGGGTDSLEIDGSTEADTVELTDSGFTMNGAAGATAGLEALSVFGDAGDDNIDASGASLDNFFTLDGEADNDTVTGGSGDDGPSPLGVFGGDDDDLVAGGDGDDYVDGDAGDDTVYEGTARNGDDVLEDGPGAGDTLDYGDRTGCMFISEGINLSGEDSDCSGVLDPGEEMDTPLGFQILIGGSNNDVITGNGSNETFIGNDGNDVVDGDGGFDINSWETATGPITVDSAAGTSTGQGDDSWTNIEELLGSPSPDDLLDFSGEAAGVGANLSDQGPFPFPPVPVGANGDIVGSSSFIFVTPETFEHAIGTAFDDHLVGGNTSDSGLMGGDGNDRIGGLGAQDKIEGQGGNDLMFGDDGNDTLMGGPGDDTYIGGTGADKASWKNSAAAVEVDASLGFASGEGDDVLADDLEIFVGSSFGDTMVGGGGLVASNYRFIGRGGPDTLTGSGSNDTIKGGGGKDVLRGAAGDDTIKGNKGNDRLFGGAGTDIGYGGKGKDVCKGIQVRHSCGTAKHPKAPQTQVAAHRQV